MSSVDSSLAVGSRVDSIRNTQSPKSGICLAVSTNGFHAPLTVAVSQPPRPTTTTAPTISSQLRTKRPR